MSVASELFEASATVSARLSAIAQGLRLQRAHICTWHEGKTFRAYNSDIHETELGSPNLPCHKVRAGCIVKLMTATLIAHAIADGLISADQSIECIFKDGRKAISLPPPIASLKLTDILHHTHGLDSSAMHHVPINAETGCIDTAQLCNRLIEHPLLAAPGEYYSYGSAGSWLAALVLEHVHQESFTRILLRELLRPLNIGVCTHDDFLCDESALARAAAQETRSGVERRICPAQGGDLCVSVEDLIALGRYHLIGNHSDKRSHAIGLLRTLKTKPPGWHPRMNAICLGFTDFGDDWYGHNSIYQNESAILRFSPGRQCAIAITADRSEGAYLLLGGLFGKWLREFQIREVPRAMRFTNGSPTDTAKYCGVYRNAATQIEISEASSHRLRAVVYARRGAYVNWDSPLAKRSLRQSSNGVFWPEPPESITIPFVQFLGLSPKGTYQHIHNGRQLFTRYCNDESPR
jgi:CubicO group peptidase (beta-lactamase class C family)